GGDTSEKAKGLLARMRQKRAGNAPTQQAAQAEKEIVAAQQEVVQDVVKETVKRTVQAVKEVGKQKSAVRLEVEASRPAGANLPRVGVRGRR
ncbi:hypothetical protein, partial [Pseudomonas marginalis]|uniref:hypothetical protein n=1 Tax=Pseudomonas marginalis TaxID=298 RepID=UPI0034D5AF02